ncbi:hypothetical protein PVK06_041366 [Gossypium arboreum]|uniref:Uncharacterized protein n=1 Tax=Gossypium arboreum TaxID=29729 RepID=A0ABR0N807_GOSAR|nr:hypothetical protein PVK06_041366 [Gossypium arboreum]
MPIQDQPLGGERKGKECGRGTKCIPTKPPHRRCKGCRLNEDNSNFFLSTPRLSTER